MKTSICNHIYVKDASPDLIDWAKKNLIFDNPDFYKMSMLNPYISKKIPRVYKIYETIGDDIILPFGVLKRVWGLINKGEVSVDFHDKRPITMEGEIKLYDYQEKAVSAMENAKSGILVAPCGSGKTQMGIELINRIGGRALWLTHTRDLLNQSMTRAKMYFKGDFGTITEGKVDIGKDITFATVQTMVNLDLPKYRDMWDVIVVDEAHKVAGTPTKLMMFYKVVTNLNARFKFGLSATMHRSDAMVFSTYAVLGDKVYEVTDKMVGDKIIKAKHEKVISSLPESFEYLQGNGMLDYQALINYISFDEERNKFIAKIVNSEPDKVFLVLCSRVEHTSILREMIGEGAVMNGHTPKSERDEILQRTRDGNNRVIIATYNLAKEGLDVPNFDRLIFATPQKDYTIVKQSAGRIERNIEGKEQPVLYDIVDVNIGVCERWYKKRVTILKK